MSYCREEGANGKDKIIFVTKEDHNKTSTTVLDDLDDDEPGLILDNGDINWSCPCLGGMATGPCGVEFREAFSCFHYSEEEAKGSDCYEPFRKMQECMAQYPDLYDDDKDKDKKGGGTPTETPEIPNNGTNDTSSTEKAVAS